MRGVHTSRYMWHAWPEIADSDGFVFHEVGKSYWLFSGGAHV